MARSNRGRSTTGEPAVPYYTQARHIECAKHLRLTVTRYLANRATLADINEAHSLLVAAAPVAGEPGFRKAATTTRSKTVTP